MTRLLTKILTYVFAIANISLGLYMLSAPIYSDAKFYLTKSVKSGSKPKQTPTQDVLSIPSIGLWDVVYEGDSAQVLQKGIWRRPKTATPDKPGNTVFVAHRFAYANGPNNFYHLPKVSVGDEMTVYWRQKAYTYKVSRTQVVDPDDVHIESHTDKPTLTLYTCTPLWTSAKRFVVIAQKTRSKIIAE